MRNALLVAAVGLMLVVAGCENGKFKCPFAKKKATTQETMKMDSMKDDCPMCAGVQHANADGRCPKCGMKVKG